MEEGSGGGRGGEWWKRDMEEMKSREVDVAVWSPGPHALVVHRPAVLGEVIREQLQDHLGEER